MTFFRPVLLVLSLALSHAVCAQAVPSAAGGAVPAALSVSALSNMTLRGLSDTPQVTLRDGAWQGKPYVKGGAEAPQVTLMRNPIAYGDLDRDGRPEAVMLLTQSTGGSGQFLHVAVAGARRGQPRSLAATQVGDRVQVRDVRVQNGRIWLDVVRAGPDDPACCPGEVASVGWTLSRGRLVPIKDVPPVSRLGPATLGGNNWVLREWRSGEAAVAQPPLTLSHQDGRFVGHSGCNRFMVEVTARGDLPGDVKVATPGLTRMACEGDAAVTESRFLDQLARVRRMGFREGRLALDYEVPGDDRPHAMLFERE
jgi:hypothetical protein